MRSITKNFKSKRLISESVKFTISAKNKCPEMGFGLGDCVDLKCWFFGADDVGYQFASIDQPDAVSDFDYSYCDDSGTAKLHVELDVEGKKFRYNRVLITTEFYSDGSFEYEVIIESNGREIFRSVIPWLLLEQGSQTIVAAWDLQSGVISFPFVHASNLGKILDKEDDYDNRFFTWRLFDNFKSPFHREPNFSNEILVRQLMWGSEDHLSWLIDRYLDEIILLRKARKIEIIEFYGFVVIDSEFNEQRAKIVNIIMRSGVSWKEVSGNKNSPFNGIRNLVLETLHGHSLIKAILKNVPDEDLVEIAKGQGVAYELHKLCSRNLLLELMDDDEIASVLERDLGL